MISPGSVGDETGNFPRNGGRGGAAAPVRVAPSAIPERTPPAAALKWKTPSESTLVVQLLGLVSGRQPRHPPVRGSPAGSRTPVAVPEGDTTVRRGFRPFSDTPTNDVISSILSLHGTTVSVGSLGVSSVSGIRREGDTSRRSERSGPKWCFSAANVASVRSDFFGTKWQKFARLNLSGSPGQPLAERLW